MVSNAASLGFPDVSKESVALIFKGSRPMKKRYSLRAVNP
jgi:hypothetical protein